jgi:hypothetical protein
VECVYFQEKNSFFEKVNGLFLTEHYFFLRKFNVLNAFEVKHSTKMSRTQSTSFVFFMKMFPKQTIQQEKQGFDLPKPIAIDENRKCLICGREVEREIVDLNCSCFRNRLCHFCAHLLFKTRCSICCETNEKQQRLMNKRKN